MEKDLEIPTNEQFAEPSVRQAWYRRLSEAHREELFELLEITSRFFEDVTLKYIVIDELYEAFGNIVLHNVYEIDSRIILPSKLSPKLSLGVLPMESLGSSFKEVGKKGVEKRTREERDLLIRKKIEELYEGKLGEDVFYKDACQTEMPRNSVIYYVIWEVGRTSRISFYIYAHSGMVPLNTVLASYGQTATRTYKISEGNSVSIATAHSFPAREAVEVLGELIWGDPKAFQPIELL